MNRLIRNAIVTFSGNPRSQRVLKRLVLAGQDLMGIGCAGASASSGERVLALMLRQKSALAQRRVCVLDVGANRGQFLTMITTGLGEVPYHVHSFEPGASAYRQLCDAHGANPYVTLNNVGLGRERGSAKLYYEAEGSTLASVYQRRLGHAGVFFAGSEIVSIRTLDDYADEAGLGSIDLLKLDVEGHELAVLHGASGLLQADRIDVIAFEFGGCNIDSRTFFQDFWYFFRNHGSFGLYRMTPSGYLAPIDQYHELDEQFRRTNFIAVRQGVTAAERR
jgi:FkbM family methyltransferase